MFSKYYYWLLILVTMAAVSCSTTKSVPRGDALYTGASVTVKDDVVSRKKKKEVRKELEKLTRPRPNKKMLGLPIKLWAYNFAGTKKAGRGLRGWLKINWASPRCFSAK